MKQIVSNGLVVYIRGFEFRVSAVRVVKAHDESDVVRFTGTCTDDSRNDSIRHTAYNGGTYGGNRLSNYAF